MLLVSFEWPWLRASTDVSPDVGATYVSLVWSLYWILPWILPFIVKILLHPAVHIGRRLSVSLTLGLHGCYSTSIMSSTEKACTVFKVFWYDPTGIWTPVFPTVTVEWMLRLDSIPSTFCNSLQRLSGCLQALGGLISGCWRNLRAFDWIFMPDSTLIRCWEYMMIMTIVVVGFLYPYNASFICKY